MEQNKLENQIREKLNSREIQPSAQAWDRLDAMLTVAEEKKTKRSFGWLYIAAGILVFVSAGMFFFKQGSGGIEQQNQVVGTEVKKDSVEKRNGIQSPIMEKAHENQVAVVPVKETGINSKSSNNNQSVSIINQKSNESQIHREKTNDVAVNDLPKSDEKKANETSTKSLKSIPSDEQLLAGLDNTAKKMGSEKSGVKVDAKSLLSQVDGELEMSFRERVINKVNKNYKEVKVALANRNTE